MIPLVQCITLYERYHPLFLSIFSVSTNSGWCRYIRPIIIVIATKAYLKTLVTIHTKISDKLLKMHRCNNAMELAYSAHIRSIIAIGLVVLILYALSTGSKSLNASNTLPTKFSQLPNLYYFITSSLLNVLALLPQSISLSNLF